MPEIENKYEFSLRCNFQWLHSITSCGYDFNIYDIPDIQNDTISNDFCFNTRLCNDVQNKEYAFAIGQELLSLFNGVCLIFDINHEFLEITHLIHNDSTVSVSGDLSVNMNEATFNEAPNSSHKEDVCNSIRFYLLDKSKSNEDVYDLLKIFSTSPDLRAQATILEMLEHFSRANNIDINALHDNYRTERGRFTAFANNRSVSGIESRHGQSSGDRPRNPMNIQEAKVFIFDMSQKVLMQFASNSTS